MSYSGLLNQTCTIERPVPTEDVYGHAKIGSWTSIATLVACNIQLERQTAPKINLTSSGIREYNDYIGFFLSDQDIQANDRATWNSIYLYVRPVNFVYNSTVIHHKEVRLALQQT